MDWHTCNCLCPSFFCSIIIYNNYFLVTAMLLNGNHYKIIVIIFWVVRWLCNNY